jgi:hypothetical protein
MLNKKDVMDKINELMERVNEHTKRRQCTFCHSQNVQVSAVGQGNNIFQFQLFCKDCKRSNGFVKQEQNGDWNISILLPKDRLSFLDDITGLKKRIQDSLKPII